MEVVLLASEVAPIAKVGGLADVVGALPIALSKVGMTVRVIVPRYGIIDLASIPHSTPFPDIAVPWNGGQERVTVHETKLPNSSVPLYLIEHQGLLSQDGIYPSSDILSETTRFAFFSRAAVSLMEAAHWPIDVIHCHDWQASWVPTLLASSPMSKNEKKPKTLLTIHNLAMQGIAPADDMRRFFMIDPQKIFEQNDGNANFLRQGILTADAINTVSPAYAKEILTPEYGAGLEVVLAGRQERLMGIVNGIDHDRFNPETDRQIAINYSAATIEKKRENKAVLQKICNLPVDPSIPVLGLVSRLTDQKGIDLITQRGDKLLKRKLQLVVLGTGYPEIELSLRELAQRHPQTLHISITFDAKLAQQIYAGADMFLMPSRFEPCGLGQLIAMRYGTVPIVRATGGLRDTVQRLTTDGRAGDGVVFDDPTPEALERAIHEATLLFQNEEVWHTIGRRIMQKNFSWEASSRAYAKLYRSMVSSTSPSLSYAKAD